jgi:hypothetical protein
MDSGGLMMTTRERLETLSDFLEHTVQPALDGAKFDMGRWGSAVSALPPRSTNVKRLSECGFAGRAVGWGYFCLELRKEGIPVEHGWGSKSLHVPLGYHGLARFFGLDPAAAEWLFSPDSYEDWDQDPPIDVVIARIRAAITGEIPYLRDEDGSPWE